MTRPSQPATSDVSSTVLPASDDMRRALSRVIVLIYAICLGHALVGAAFLNPVELGCVVSGCLLLAALIHLVVRRIGDVSVVIGDDSLELRSGRRAVGHVDRSTIAGIVVGRRPAGNWAPVIVGTDGTLYDVGIFARNGEPKARLEAHRLAAAIGPPDGGAETPAVRQALDAPRPSTGRESRALAVSALVYLPSAF